MPTIPGRKDVVDGSFARRGDDGGDGDFESVTAKWIYVENEAGQPVVLLGASDGGQWLVRTMSGSGKDVVRLGATTEGWSVTTHSRSGKKLVDLSSKNGGGGLWVYNRGGGSVVQAYDYGHGIIDVFWDPNGKGRTLTPR